jgi:undecaprenyl-diphosphatase
MGQGNKGIESSGRSNPVEAAIALVAEPVTCPGFFSRLMDRSPRVAGWVETLQEADLEAVRIISRSAQGPIARLCAIVISKLGNGWFYLFLAALIFARWGLGGARLILLAGVNAGVMHSLYPLIKNRYQRRRPFRVDPELSSLLATLDEHSFPSGHAMTLSAVLTPIVMLWPAMAVPGAVMVIGLAWSRVATAHHYPSDVLAGSMLGLGLGYPISAGVLAFW